MIGRKLKKRSRNRKVCNLRSARTVGIVFKCENNHMFEAVHNFVKKCRDEGKDVFAIGYVPEKKVPENYVLRKSLHFFCISDLNWYYKPVKPFVEVFINERFDLLIDLSVNTSYPVKYITALSDSGFKAGKRMEGTDHLDLCIDIRESRDIDYLLQQIIHYLNLLNSS